MDILKRIEVIKAKAAATPFEGERKVLLAWLSKLQSQVSFENTLPDFSKGQQRVYTSPQFEPLFRGTQVDITA
jgi:hypothetical protein